MKVIYFCNEVSKKNGWCVINYYTVKQAVEKGYEVNVFTARGADNVPISGVTYIPVLFGIGKIKEDFVRFILSFFIIGWKLFTLRPDVVHILVEPYLIYFSVLKHRCVYMTIVGTYALSIFQQSRAKALYFRALSKVEKIVSISRYTAIRFVQATKYKKPIDVIIPGVESEFFGVQSFKKEPCFSFVGHIKPRKGLIYALKAMKKVTEIHPEAQLYVAGLFEDPSYSQLCMNFVNDAGLKGNVHFLGKMDHPKVKELYSKSILNILPSYNSNEGSFEGFGLIHLEANAAGTLTLGTKDTGNESAIVDGVSGFLVNQENFEEIADKMTLSIDLLKSNQYGKYAQQCIEHAQRSNWQAYFAKLDNCYRAVEM